MAEGLFPVLNVNDLPASLAFYKALGFKVKRESMGPMQWGSVELTGSSGMVIIPIEGLLADPEQREWASGPLGHGILLTIGVKDAEKVWAKAQAAKASIDTPIQPNPWGGFGFIVADPDGYLLSITDRFPGEPQPRRAAKAKAPAKKAARKATTKAAAKKGAKKAAPKKAAAKKGVAKKAPKAKKAAPRRR